MASSIADLLRATLDPKQHKQAESALREAEKQPGFSISLLEITASDSFQLQDRLAGALCFKNLMRRSWTDPDGNYKLPENEVTTIKTQLVGLMTTTPSAIQAQLGDAISIIAESDFPERWESLVDDLVSKLTADDPMTNNGVLQVAHSIFQRWRPLFRSDGLYAEINYVLQKFGTPFVQLLVSTDQKIGENKDNKAVLQQYFTAFDTELQLLYDLSCQDLPPVFEDNLSDLSALLQKYLTYDSPSLHTDDDSEAGSLEKTKSSIFEILTLFVQKYEDAFSPFIPAFIEHSWTLLTATGTETKFDTLVSRALHFLTSVTANPAHAASFNNEGILGSVLEGVVLPNMSLRESDVELFEDEPIEFIRRDLEGTDSETRRRSATDFLRRLMGLYQERVTTVVMRYVNTYLEDSHKNADTSWRSKDAAVYLFCSIAAVGAVTANFGVQTTNPHVNIIDFFTKNIAHDLVSDASHVLLKVDAIKYLYTFRRQITPVQWQEVFPMLVRDLGSDNYVVHTYSAITIDRVLILSDDTGNSVIAKSKLLEISERLLQQLFKMIEKNPAPEKVQENEFLMRCVMRILIVSKADILPHTEFISKHLINITKVIRHNPSNPRFYYYLFEAMGALIVAAGPTDSAKLENNFYEPFSAILSEDVQEFVPYVFQLFAALLECNPSGSLPQTYQGLVQPVLTPSLWDSKGTIPALTRLLSAFISRGAAQMVQTGQTEQVLGLWQKLNAYKASESSAFDLLETIISYFPPDILRNYNNNIFTLIFTRLSNNKTENYGRNFARFYHFMCARSEEGYGTDSVITIFETVRTGVFAQLYPSTILPDTLQLIRPIDRKIAVVSLTKTLADSNTFAEQFKVGWARTCETLLKLMLDPPKPATADASIASEQDVDDLAFGVGFTQLTTCRRPAQDPYASIQDLRSWIGEYLKDANQRHNGRIATFIQDRLPAETQQTLTAYMQS